MRVIQLVFRSFDEPARIAVDLSPEEASALSSVLGYDICSAHSRYVSIDTVERMLNPMVLLTCKPRFLEKGCCIVFSVPEAYLDIVANINPGKSPVENLIDYLEMLSKILKAVYEILSSETNKESEINKEPREEKIQRLYILDSQDLAWREGKKVRKDLYT